MGLNGFENGFESENGRLMLFLHQYVVKFSSLLPCTAVAKQHTHPD